MRQSTLSIFTLTATLAVGAGCESQTDKVSGVSKEARQAISEAAVARYPGNAVTSRDVQAVAIDYPEKKYLEIHNPGTRSIPSGMAWVNGTFLTRFEGIAPKSFTTVNYSQLLEAGPATNDLKSLNQPVARVEIQTDRGLYSVQGPTLKH